MSFLKRLLYIFLIVTILVASGCVNNKANKVDIKTEVLSYMKDKYNENFKILNTNNETWMADHTEILLSAESFPEKTIVVHRRNDNTGEITDNFLAIKLNSDIEEKISEVVYEVYGDNKTFNYPMSVPLSISLPSNSSAEDYLRAKPQITDVTIFVTKDLDGKEKDLETFRTALEDRGYFLTFSIVYIDQSLVSLDSINKENYIEYADDARNEVLAYGEFIIDKNHDFSYKKWR